MGRIFSKWSRLGKMLGNGILGKWIKCTEYFVHKNANGDGMQGRGDERLGKLGKNWLIYAMNMEVT
jgi:hypothetical protein